MIVPSKTWIPLIAAGLLVACGPSRPEVPAEPHVFFIVCDTLRADHVGCYGYERDTTDNLDRMAAQSTVFSNAITQAPATIPSMWNMMTSMFQSWVPAAAETVTMAEYFKDRGYRTGAFLAHQFLKPGMSSLDQGFNVYDYETQRDHHGNATRRAESVVTNAITWFDRNDDKPCFMWLVFFDPHDPYLAPPTFQGFYNEAETFSGDRRAEGLFKESREIPPEHREYLINAYDEEIRYMDSELGRFLDHLRAKGVYESSLIVFTSDHGEELGDNGNLWDHAQLLSREELSVPLVLKLPNQTEGRVVDAAAQNIDVYPTMVEYLDGERLPDHWSALEGTSLLPLIEGRETGEDRLSASFWLYQAAVLDSEKKYWMTNDSERVLDLESGDELDDAEAMELMRDHAGQLMLKWQLAPGYYDDTVRYLKSLGYF